MAAGVLTLGAFCTLPAVAQAEGICHVNASVSSTSMDGTTWDTAYADLQDALLNPGCSTIWVAKGTYKPTRDNDRYVSFNIRSGIQVYGGFAGNESELGDRDFVANETILSGDIGQPGVDTDNSNHVVYMDGRQGANITQDTVLDGFTITGGYASSWSLFNYEASYGGGFYCDGSGAGNECSPTLRHVTFRENYATYYGGAMYNNGHDGTSSPALYDVTFTQNVAGLDGGAIYTHSSGGTSHLTLAGARFEDNHAGQRGGAIYTGSRHGAATQSTLTDVAFSRNTADLGGAIYNIAVGFSTNTSSLRQVLFQDSAARAGGAIFNHVASISEGTPFLSYDSSTSTLSLNSVVFYRNSADESGGAVFNQGAPAAAHTLGADVEFIGNRASSDSDIGAY